jgi:hypothetical protein
MHPDMASKAGQPHCIQKSRNLDSDYARTAQVEYLKEKLVLG